MLGGHLLNGVDRLAQLPRRDHFDRDANGQIGTGNKSQALNRLKELEHPPQQLAVADLGGNLTRPVALPPRLLCFRDNR